MNVVRLMVVGNSMEAGAICGLLRTEGIACDHLPPALLQRIGLALGAPAGRPLGHAATYEPAGGAVTATTA